MKLLILALCVTAAIAEYHQMDNNEVKLVLDTWNKVKHNEVDILYNIFHDNADIMAKFSQFNGKDLEGLKGTKDFATHATRIVSFLDYFVLLSGDFHNYGGIKILVNEMGKNHKNRGVSKDQFGEFKNTFFKYMRGHVDFNGATEHAWNDLFDNLYFIVFSNLDGHSV